MSEKCNSCGAEIEYEAGSQSLQCPYCGAKNDIQKAESLLPCQVEVIIPLKVSLDDLEKRVYGYMASGNYTPDDMLEATTFTKQECFYVPAFLFRVEYDATWTASFGYDRTEHYTVYESQSLGTDSRGHSRGYHQVPVTKTKTVTDWRPANGVDSDSFKVSAYAGKKLFESGCSAKNGKEPIVASKKNSSNWIDSLASKLEALGNKKSSEVDSVTVKDESGLAPVELVKYAISQALAQNIITDFNPSFMKGVEGESFNISEPNAYSNLKSEINANIDQRVEKHGQGDRQKDWHWNAKMSHSTNTLYVPICHAVFDYQGTEYHVWTDGIGESEIRADKLPEDKGRKKSIYLGFIPAGAAIIGGSVVTALFLAGYAAIRRRAILGYSKKIRDSLLTQIHASASTLKEMTGEERDKIAKAFQRPEKPFFAKTHKDKIVLPVLSLLAIISWFIHNDTASTNNVKNTPQAEMLAASEPIAVPVSALPAVVQPDPASAVEAASSAELIKIAETEEIAIYVNPASIQKNGDKATILTLADFKMPKNTKEGRPYLSTTNQEEFDCKENKERLLHILTSYSGNMGKGGIAVTNSGSNPIPGEWSQVTSNTLEGAIFKVACGQNAPVPAGVEASSTLVAPQSASFDCKKAKSNSEVLICSDAALSKLDYELAEIYRRAKAKALDAQEFKKQTVAAWQWRETNCRDNKECLVTWYAERKAVLLKNIQDSASN